MFPGWGAKWYQQTSISCKSFARILCLIFHLLQPISSNVDQLIICHIWDEIESSHVSLVHKFPQNFVMKDSG